MVTVPAPSASDSRRAAPEGVRGLVGVLAQLAAELLHRMCGRSPCRRCVQCPRPLNGELSERNPSVAHVLDEYNVFDTRPCLCRLALGASERVSLDD